MSAHQGRQAHDLFGAFLQQQKIGMMHFHQFGDIFDAGADPAQQIPAHDTQPAGRRLIREIRRHLV
jgi:hypothetical protein